ncbi:MAG: peroxiredoxin-like family protein [Pseudomonadota bacterium]
MNLLHDLERERVYWLQQQQAPASAIEVMAMEFLRRAGIEGKALRVGERAPSFRLPDQHGQLVELSTLLAQGPTVLVFYRGHWCPFCSLTLRSYRQAAFQFAALRSPMVAISPQGAIATSLTAASVGEGLPLLSDVGSHVARAYGLAYDLPAALKGLFEGEYATHLPEINADGGWTLPVAATYVIAQNGIVLRAHVDVDFRHREDPEALLDWLANYHRADESQTGQGLA